MVRYRTPKSRGFGRFKFRFSKSKITRADIAATVGQISGGLITLWVANAILDLTVPRVNGTGAISPYANTSQWFGNVTGTVQGSMPILALLTMILPILNLVRKGLY